MKQIILNIKKATLLLSGGPDSVTLGFYLRNNGVDFNAITFLHNPRGSNIDEVNSAIRFAKIWNIEHNVFDCSNLFELYKTNENYKFSLGGAKDCIPNNLKQTPLSVHNMLFMASMYAITTGSDSIAWAIHQDDLIKITEKEVEKIKYLISELVTDEIGYSFSIQTPFQKLYKRQIFTLSKKFNINVTDTVSCFDSVNNSPCGKCIKCIERELALTQSSKSLTEIWQEK